MKRLSEILDRKPGPRQEPDGEAMRAYWTKVHKGQRTDEEQIFPGACSQCRGLGYLKFKSRPRGAYLTKQVMVKQGGSNEPAKTDGCTIWTCPCSREGGKFVDRVGQYTRQQTALYYERLWGDKLVEDAR